MPKYQILIQSHHVIWNGTAFITGMVTEVVNVPQVEATIEMLEKEFKRGGDSTEMLVRHTVTLITEGNIDTVGDVEDLP